MSGATQPDQPGARLARLLTYLRQDPDNRQLLADAAQTAFDEGAPDEADRLLQRYAALEPLPPELQSLHGLSLMGLQRYDQAVDLFAALAAAQPGNATVRLNLAWAYALNGDPTAAEATIDDALANADVRAAVLKLRMLHKLERLDEALAHGLGYVERHPGDRALLGALSELALDLRDVDLARDLATRAGDTPEGLSTLGVLELSEDRTDAALATFDRALALQGGNPRALLGKGLSLLAAGQPAAAAASIDRAAEQFGDHIGSWVAAGWTYFILGDRAASRARFERALALDDAFAESQGGLATLDAIDGNLTDAKRRAAVALRLDRHCLGGALAQSLILAREGDEAGAARVYEAAVNTPLGDSGRTIAQAIGLGIGSSTRPKTR